MQIFRALLAAIVLLAQPAFAAPLSILLPDKADTVIVPEASGLKFRKFDDMSQAVFTGQLTLTGTYYYGPNAIDDGTNSLTLYFRPDKPSAARMPYLKSRGKPGDMVLTNDAAFARAAFSREGLARVKQSYATGTITVTVDTVSAGVICDGPSWTARFVSAVKPIPVKFGPLPDMGC
jgi:hypothetical protein